MAVLFFFSFLWPKYFIEDNYNRGKKLFHGFINNVINTLVNISGLFFFLFSWTFKKWRYKVTDREEKVIGKARSHFSVLKSFSLFFNLSISINIKI